MKPIYKLDENQISNLHKLYEKEWWTEKRTLEETKKVLNNSSIVIGLKDLGELIFMRKNYE